jgi:acyl-coenzyme A synthetase/AMP-(fatty) acid ligase
VSASIPDQRRAPPTSNGGLPAEDRVFPPSPRFAADANLTAEAYQRPAQDPEGFWAERDVMGRAACDGTTWARSSTGARHPPQAFPAEQPLFAVYTSGVTGTPGGIRHTSGVYRTQAADTHRVVFDHIRAAVSQPPVSPAAAKPPTNRRPGPTLTPAACGVRCGAARGRIQFQQRQVQSMQTSRPAV